MLICQYSLVLAPAVLIYDSLAGLFIDFVSLTAGLRHVFRRQIVHLMVRHAYPPDKLRRGGLPSSRAPKSPLAGRKSSAANGLMGRQSTCCGPNTFILAQSLFSGEVFFRQGPGAFGLCNGPESNCRETAVERKANCPT